MTLLSCAYAGTGNVLKVHSYNNILVYITLKIEISAAAFYV